MVCFSSLDDKSFFSILTTFNLPYPKILIPFKNSFNGWFGNETQSITGHDELNYEWKPDYYGFPNHALHVTQTSNSVLMFDDVSEAVNPLSGFTILFHMKFLFHGEIVTFFQFGDDNDENKFSVTVNDDELILK